MSRWRETLCGKVAVGSPPPSPLEQLGATSQDVLSCGGVYIPQTSKTAGQQPVDFIFLPKASYEMLRFETDKEMVRFGSSFSKMDEEGAMPEWNFDSESHKFTR